MKILKIHKITFISKDSQKKKIMKLEIEQTTDVNSRSNMV